MTDDDTIRYDKLVENSLRGVIEQAVNQVEATGLPGDHHFYITFDTNHTGIQIPDYLKSKYPSEMTIVLQYQFYGLKIANEAINVTLSFDNKPENLIIPLESIIVFADPSVNFALQFQTYTDADFDDEDYEESFEDGLIEETPAANEKDKTDKKTKGRRRSDKKGDGKSENVVSLDQFRKK